MIAILNLSVHEQSNTKGFGHALSIGNLTSKEKQYAGRKKMAATSHEGQKFQITLPNIFMKGRKFKKHMSSEYIYENHSSSSNVQVVFIQLCKRYDVFQTSIPAQKFPRLVVLVHLTIGIGINRSTLRYYVFFFVFP